MKPETQNTNSQPNYDFILNQAEPGQPAPGAKKPKNKMFIWLLTGGGFLILLLIGLAAYVTVATNVQQKNGTQISSPTVEKASEVLGGIKSENYDEVAKLLNSGVEKPESSANIAEVFSYLSNESCQLGEPTVENEVTTIVISCKTTKVSPSKVAITMNIIQGEQKATITYYYMEPAV